MSLCRVRTRRCGGRPRDRRNVPIDDGPCPRRHAAPERLLEDQPTRAARNSSTTSSSPTPWSASCRTPRPSRSTTSPASAPTRSWHPEQEATVRPPAGDRALRPELNPTPRGRCRHRAGVVHAGSQHRPRERRAAHRIEVIVPDRAYDARQLVLRPGVHSGSARSRLGREPSRHPSVLNRLATSVMSVNESRGTPTDA